MIGSLLPAGIAVAEATGELNGAYLLPEEQACLKSASEKRSREFTTGRTCARRALAEIGVNPTPILPGSSRQPLWPAGVTGSITHCEGYCAAAVARRDRFMTIGIDAETHEQLPAGVVEIVALEAERRWLSSLSQHAIHWDRVLFSVKESVYKAWFPLTEKWLEFKDVIVDMDPKSQSFQARVLLEPPTANHSLTVFTGRYLIAERLILTAVCVEAR